MDIIDCSAETLFPNAKATIFCEPKGYAVNNGGPHGFDTKSPVWDVVDDPLRFLDACWCLPSSWMVARSPCGITGMTCTSSTSFTGVAIEVQDIHHQALAHAGV
jgi:hypothetical protein